MILLYSEVTKVCRVVRPFIKRQHFFICDCLPLSGLYRTWTLDCGLDYGLMIIQSNSASVQIFFVIFSCLAIMLSAISASGMEGVHGSTQTGKDYSNTTVNSQ